MVSVSASGTPLITAPVSGSVVMFDRLSFSLTK
jgi:hypothetical protein